MKTYHCPNDERVFETVTDHSAPTLTGGHPDCPGPWCTKKHAGSITPSMIANRKRAEARKALDAVHAAQKQAEIAMQEAEAAEKEALAPVAALSPAADSVI